MAFFAFHGLWRFLGDCLQRLFFHLASLFSCLAKESGGCVNSFAFIDLPWSPWPFEVLLRTDAEKDSQILLGSHRARLPPWLLQAVRGFPGFLLRLCVPADEHSHHKKHFPHRKNRRKPFLGKKLVFIVRPGWVCGSGAGVAALILLDLIVLRMAKVGLCNYTVRLRWVCSRFLAMKIGKKRVNKRLSQTICQ